MISSPLISVFSILLLLLLTIILQISSPSSSDSFSVFFVAAQPYVAPGGVSPTGNWDIGVDERTPDFPFILDGNNLTMQQRLSYDPLKEIIFNGFIPPFQGIIVRNLVVHTLTFSMYHFVGSWVIVDNVTTTNGPIRFTQADVNYAKTHVCPKWNNTNAFKAVANNVNWWSTTANDIRERYFLKGPITYRQQIQNITIKIENCNVNLKWSNLHFDSILVRLLRTCPYFNGDITDSTNPLQSVLANQTQLNVIVRKNSITTYKLETVSGAVIGVSLAPDIYGESAESVPVTVTFFSVDVSYNTITMQKPVVSQDPSKRGWFRMSAIFMGYTWWGSNDEAYFFYADNTTFPVESFQLVPNPFIKMNNNDIKIDALFVIHGFASGHFGDWTKYNKRELSFPSSSSSPPGNNNNNSPTYLKKIFCTYNYNNFNVIGEGKIYVLHLQFEFPYETIVNVSFNNFNITHIPRENYTDPGAMSSPNAYDPRNIDAIIVETVGVNEDGTGGQFASVYVNSNICDTFSDQSWLLQNYLGSGPVLIKDTWLEFVASKMVQWKEFNITFNNVTQILVPNAPEKLYYQGSTSRNAAAIIASFDSYWGASSKFPVNLNATLFVAHNIGYQQAASSSPFIEFNKASCNKFIFANNTYTVDIPRSKGYLIRLMQFRIYTEAIVEDSKYLCLSEDCYGFGEDNSEQTLGVTFGGSFYFRRNRIDFIRSLSASYLTSSYLGLIELSYQKWDFVHIQNNNYSSNHRNRNGMFNNVSRWFSINNAKKLLVEGNHIEEQVFKEAGFATINAREPNVQLQMREMIIRNNFVRCIGVAGCMFLPISTAIGEGNEAIGGMQTLPVIFIVESNTIIAEKVQGIKFVWEDYPDLEIPFMTTILSLAACDIPLLVWKDNNIIGYERYAIGFQSNIQQTVIEKPCSKIDDERMTPLLLRRLMAIPLPSVLQFFIFGTAAVIPSTYPEIIAKGCDYSPTHTFTPRLTESDELTVTHELTQTRNKTLTVTKSQTYVPKLKPEKGLSAGLRSAVSAASLTAAAASIFAGSTAALDAGRALSLLSIVARCRNYDEALASIDAQLPANPNDQEEFQRKKKETKDSQAKEYADEYLKRDISFPESYLPGLCYGSNSGACLRGGVVGGFVWIFILIFIAFGMGTTITVLENRKLFKAKNRKAIDDGVVDTKVATSFSKMFSLQKVIVNGKFPLVLIQGMAIQLGTWMPHALAFLVSHGLAFFDRLLFGAIPVFFFWMIPSVLFIIYLQHAHLSRAFEKRSDSRFLACCGYKKKMNREAAFQLEPLFLYFPKARKLESDITFAPSTLQLKIIEFCEVMFSKSVVGKWVFTGDYCWSQGSTKQSMNQGGPSSFLRQCGAVVNKFYGPLSTDAKRKWFMDLHAKKNNNKGLQEQDFTLLEGDKNTIHNVANKSQPWRCRIAPFTVFINSCWTVAACLAQSVAAVHPNRCSDTIVVMIVMSVLALFVSVFTRPNLAHMKNVAVVCSDVLVLVGCILAWSAMKIMKDSISENLGLGSSSSSSSTTSTPKDFSSSSVVGTTSATTTAGLSTATFEVPEAATYLTSVAQVILLISVGVVMVGSFPLALTKLMVLLGYVKLCTRAEMEKLIGEEKEQFEEQEELTSMVKRRKQRSNSGASNNSNNNNKRRSYNNNNNINTNTNHFNRGETFANEEELLSADQVLRSPVTTRGNNNRRPRKKSSPKQQEYSRSPTRNNKGTPTATTLSPQQQALAKAIRGTSAFADVLLDLRSSMNSSSANGTSGGKLPHHSGMMPMDLKSQSQSNSNNSSSEEINNIPTAHHHHHQNPSPAAAALVRTSPTSNQKQQNGDRGLIISKTPSPTNNNNNNNNRNVMGNFATAINNNSNQQQHQQHQRSSPPNHRTISPQHILGPSPSTPTSFPSIVNNNNVTGGFPSVVPNAAIAGQQNQHSMFFQNLGKPSSTSSPPNQNQNNNNNAGEQLPSFSFDSDLSVPTRNAIRTYQQQQSSFEQQQQQPKKPKAQKASANLGSASKFQDI